MQSFMLSSKSAQFLEYMDLRTRTSRPKCNEIVLSHYPRKMICAVLDVWLRRSCTVL